MKCESKRPEDSGRGAPGCFDQLVNYRHHAPTSIAPGSDGYPDGLAKSPARKSPARKSLARLSDAGCVFDPSHKAHKQICSLRTLDYSEVRTARDRTTSSRTHSLMSFHSTSF